MIARLLPNRVRRTYLGGGRIDAFCGITGGARSPSAPNGGCGATALPEMYCPEDWLASTTTAFNGTFEIEGEGLGRIEDGRLVRDVVGDMPFLVKLLDSDERLVIQAHPTVPCAKRLFGSPVGKTECWYFLPGTAPDACVYLGFKPGVTRSAWEQAVLESSHKERKGHKEEFENNPLLEMLHRIPVAPGDFVFVDGGVPHAIGGGCFMVELQEPSDLMVVAERMTPSARRIADVKMHGGIGWEKMFDVYEYNAFEYDDICRRYVRRGLSHKERKDIKDEASRTLRETPCICGPEFTDKFSMWRMEGQGHLELPRTACVIATDGTGAVNGRPVKKGDRLLVADERILETDGNAVLVICA